MDIHPVIEELYGHMARSERIAQKNKHKGKYEHDRKDIAKSWQKVLYCKGKYAGRKVR